MRIVVIGISGAGKSTLAHALATSTGAPHVELDALFWGPQWQPHPPPQFRAAVHAAVAQPAWIVDGNYGLVRDMIWPHADAVVWLNLPFVQVFSRLLARSLRRTFSGEALWQGNRESLRRTFFSRESLLWWVIRNHRKKQREFAQLRSGDRYPRLHWIEMRQPVSADEVLARITASPSIR